MTSKAPSFYLVHSDNVDGLIMTAAAYFEHRLGMSTGDFHCHSAQAVLPALAEHHGYWDIDETGELFQVRGDCESLSVN